ncbi:hypothetical protein [Hyphomicrobium sp.]|jgi:hypothetical protein|uniref:hypothetical protein n=1 Tax=Hyphomicrobium sp. TaxID=82 RepID=UPI003565610E
MRTFGYSADELSGFYAVLDRAARQASEREVELSISMMRKRLFAAAGQGERDVDKLIQAIFAQDASVAQSVAA